MGDNTQFGDGTPFGGTTVFDNTSQKGIFLNTSLSNLALQLYPTGRAFGVLKDSFMDKLHNAINMSFIRLLDDANSTIDSCLPDNENFDENDCALWEYRFGIVTNLSLSVEQRRTAIYRRMARGRNVPARQHKDYIQYQLQLAGFDVYVHENAFIEGGILVHKRPQDILYIQPENVQHGGSSQHGIGIQHGGVNSEVIANSYKPNEIFSVDDEHLFATFFIGGETLGQATEVLDIRQEEFRELVLKLKPAHLVAFTFINYV